MTVNRKTQEERDECIDLIASMLRFRCYKSDIKRAVRQRFGSVPARTFEWYLARARKKLTRHNKINPKKELWKSLRFYEGVISNPRTSVREKMLAQERIDHLLALAYVREEGILKRLERVEDRSHGPVDAKVPQENPSDDGGGVPSSERV